MARVRLTLMFAVVAASLGLVAAPALAACHVAAFSPASVDVEESAGEVTLTVILRGEQPSCEGTVDWATEDGTATAGEDYEEASGTLTFIEGDDRAETITIALIPDDEDEGAEDFQVALSNPTGSISSTSDPATVTVLDGPTGPSTTVAPTTSAPADDQRAATEDGGLGAGVWIVIVLVVVGAGVAYVVSRRETG